MLKNALRMKKQQKCKIKVSHKKYRYLLNETNFEMHCPRPLKTFVFCNEIRVLVPR